MQPKQPWSSERLIQLNGTLLLLLLVFIPASNAIELLTDPNLAFWMGEGQAWAWLMGCFGLVLLYLVTTQLFFAFGRPEWQNDLMVTYLARMFVTALGVMLIMQSFPLYERSEGASQLLLDECSFSDQSQSLQNTYTKLRQTREDASCRNMRTVKQCDGFTANDFTEYIQWAEDKYMCTGLCATPKAVAFVPAPGHVTKAEKIEEDNDPYQAPDFQPVQAMAPVEEAALLAANATRSKAVHAERREAVLAQQMPNVGNALFSHYTYEFHCGHMIASDLKNKGTAMSDATFAQGVALLVLVLVQSAGELISEARRPEPKRGEPFMP